MDEETRSILGSIQDSIKSLSERIEKIEVNKDNKAVNPNNTVNHDAEINNSVAQDADSANSNQTNRQIEDESTGRCEGGTSRHESVSRSVQRECDAIKDRLSKISLPNHMKLNESSIGIKQESKPVLRVMSRTARIAETALKHLTVLSLTREEADKSFKLEAEDIDSLFTLLGGIINFLQSEYTSLIVKNTFDEETSRLFKSFENHSSAFNQDSLNNLKIAADLAVARERALGNSTRRHRGGFSSFPHSFPTRGGFHRGGFNRGRGYNQDYNNYRRPPTERTEFNRDP